MSPRRIIRPRILPLDGEPARARRKVRDLSEVLEAIDRLLEFPGIPEKERLTLEQGRMDVLRQERIGKQKKGHPPTGYESWLSHPRTVRAALHGIWASDALSRGDFKKACDEYRSAIAQDKIHKFDAESAIENYFLRYYSILPKEEKNPSNGYDLPKRIITEAELREYIKEQAGLLTERLIQPEEGPFPILSGRTVKAIIAHGKKHPWDDRREQVWPYHTNAFVYVHITYRKWVNRGLTREILAQADPSLHTNLTRKISLEGLPGWLDLPTGSEAKLRSITDPIKRAKLEGVREFLRDQKRKTRSKKPTPT
jgi:hypothetical protein